MTLPTAAVLLPSLDETVMVQQGLAICAGVIVGPEQVATAAHCVTSGREARVSTRSGAVVRARVVARDAAADVAVLDVAGLTGPVARLSAAEVGDPVVVVGHPYAGQALGYFADTLAWSVTVGEVSALGPRAVQVSAPVNPGSSGGPVYGPDGVVGLVSRRLRGDGLGFATPVDAVRDLLDHPTLPWLGGEVWLGARVGRLGVIDGAVAVGGLAEVSIRDRVVFGGGAAWPVSGRWDALRLGSTRWVEGEGRAGLRLRIGDGPASTRLDAWGGVVSIGAWTSDVDLEISRSRRWAPSVGGSVRLGRNGVEVGWADGVVASLVVGVPGRVTAW